MCKDDDRVIESLVAQVNELQEKLKQYGMPEGIPEGLNEAEITAITDIYQFRCKHPETEVFIHNHETQSAHVIDITFMHTSHELTSVLYNTEFYVVISGANYQSDSENYQKIVNFLKKLLKKE